MQTQITFDGRRYTIHIFRSGMWENLQEVKKKITATQIAREVKAGRYKLPQVLLSRPSSSKHDRIIDYIRKIILENPDRQFYSREMTNTVFSSLDVSRALNYLCKKGELRRTTDPTNPVFRYGKKIAIANDLIARALKHIEASPCGLTLKQLNVCLSGVHIPTDFKKQLDHCEQLKINHTGSLPVYEYPRITESK